MTLDLLREDITTTDAFTKHLGMFTHPKGAHLIERTRQLGDWLEQRIELGTWPYARSLETPPATEARVRGQSGAVVEGVNFGSQDYLGLASHPSVHDAAIRALADYGPHAAASAILQGNTGLSRRLERALAEHVGAEHVLLFPTGWAAGFGTIVGLVRPHDHVLLDQNAHACLMQGARAATERHSIFRHNDVADARRKLAKIRAKDTENAVLVVTEGIFSMDSDSPDIKALQEACREYDAVLMVDVAHDLGASGPAGTGQLGIQGVLGEVDLVMGAFSKTFSSNGGFLATNSAAVKHFVSIYGGSHAFSNALSPIQTGIVLEALRIVRSEEGDELRRRSVANIEALREGFEAQGLECYGNVSPIVPVGVGDESLAKLTARALERRGLIANLVEYPAVARGRSRFRFQVMSTHTPSQIESAHRIFADSLDEAREQLAAYKSGA